MRKTTPEEAIENHRRSDNPFVKFKVYQEGEARPKPRGKMSKVDAENRRKVDELLADKQDRDELKEVWE